MHTPSVIPSYVLYCSYPSTMGASLTSLLMACWDWPSLLVLVFTCVYRARGLYDIIRLLVLLCRIAVICTVSYLFVQETVVPLTQRNCCYSPCLHLMVPEDNILFLRMRSCMPRRGFMNKNKHELASMQKTPGLLLSRTHKVSLGE